MFGLKNCMAAAVAAALAVASPVVAGTMVFQIDVTSATFVSGFSPSSFTETFTLAPGTYSSSGPSQDFTGGVSGSTPLTAGLQGLVDLSGATDYSNYDFQIFTPGPIFSGGDIYENLVSSNGGYQQSISGFNVGFAPPSVDEAGLAAFFAAVGPMPWYEQVEDSNYNVLAQYSGTATLVSPAGAVPEPAAWILMLLGVAGVGAALRSRQTPIAAA